MAAAAPRRKTEEPAGPTHRDIISAAVAATAAATAASVAATSASTAATTASHAADKFEAQFRGLHDRLLSVEHHRETIDSKFSGLSTAIDEMKTAYDAGNKQVLEAVGFYNAGKIGGKVVAWLGGVIIAVIAAITYFHR